MRRADLVRKLSVAAITAAAFGIAILALGRGGFGLAGSAAAQAAGGVEITAPPVTAAQWSTNGGDQAQPVTGTVMLGGQPVAGARLAVGGFRLPQPTDQQGRFVFPVDRNAVQRYPVKVVDAGEATVGGQPLSESQHTALLAAEGGINVQYRVQEVSTAVQPDGSVAVSGTVSFANGEPPAAVGLYAFRLAGTVRDTAGKPVQGVLVTGKVEDRWAVSDPTDANGYYAAVFWPTEEYPALHVVVYEGDRAYEVQGGGDVVFTPLKSARMDLTLDRSAGTLRPPQPQAIEGAVYDGTLVGVALGGEPVRPVSVTWPDQKGGFTIVLPAQLAGQRVEWWEQQGFYFSTGPGEPGTAVDVAEWPSALGPRVPRGFGSVQLPARR